MINKNKIFGLLGLATKAGKIAFGTEACIDVIDRNKAKLVIVAKDASDRTKLNFKNLCQKKKVPVYEIGTIEELSKSIGKDNKAVIVIKDINFSNAIIKIINGGEIIG